MSWLSKIAKKVKKPLLGIVRTGLAAATGGTSEAVIRTAGTVKKAVQLAGINKKLAALPKVKLAEAKYAVPSPTAATSVSATAMPGGAPLGKRAASSRKKASAPKSTKKRGKSAKRSAAGKKRGAPKGGKDFKALSASWKAAGKPGTWLQWVKSH